MFNENSVIGKRLLDAFETALDDIWVCHQISYKRQIKVIAKLLLKEVVGFVPEKGGN